MMSRRRYLLTSTGTCLLRYLISIPHLWVPPLHTSIPAYFVASTARRYVDLYSVALLVLAGAL